MKKIISYLKQKSTWKGIILIAGIAGITWSPDQWEALSAAIIGIIGAVEIFRNEKK